MSSSRSRSGHRRRWFTALSAATLVLLVAVVMLVPLVVVQVEPGAVRPSPNAEAITIRDDNWSRDRHVVTETTDAVIVERRMAVWDVLTGPPEAVLPIMNLQTAPLSAPLGDRAIVDAATGEAVPVHHP